MAAVLAFVESRPCDNPTSLLVPVAVPGKEPRALMELVYGLERGIGEDIGV